MLHYLEGEYRGLACQSSQLVEEVGVPLLVWIPPLGLGLQVWVPWFTWHQVHQQSLRSESRCSVALYTHMQIREDAWTLTGFPTTHERDLFLALLNSNGIGHKTALGLMSCLRPPELVTAIQTQQIKQLTQAKGVGKRAAEKLCVELKDKLDVYSTVFATMRWTPSELEQVQAQSLPLEGFTFSTSSTGSASVEGLEDASELLRQELKEVLRSLGYEGRIIQEALDAILPSELHYSHVQMNPLLSSGSSSVTNPSVLVGVNPSKSSSHTSEVLLQQCLKWLALHS
ncbi:MAG: Holliday junction branch migration protein RuvA [Vampirovibrionales bacterium]